MKKRKRKVGKRGKRRDAGATNGDGVNPIETPASDAPVETVRADVSTQESHGHLKITWLDNHRPKPKKADILKLSLTALRNKYSGSESPVPDAPTGEPTEIVQTPARVEPDTVASRRGGASRSDDQTVAKPAPVLDNRKHVSHIVKSDTFPSRINPNRKRNPEYVIGVDVGSDKVCALVAESVGEEIKVIGVAREPVYGVRKGEIVDMNRTADAIRIAVESASEQAGVKARSVFVSANGEHVRGLNTRAGIGIGNDDREVRRSELSRALRTAGNIDLPAERIKLHLLPQKYAVDNLNEIENPLGLTGVRLECEAHVITAPRNSVENLRRSVKRAGYWCEGVVMGIYGSAGAVLSADERRLGCLVLDIGAGTTGLMLYAGGVPRASAIIPVGGDHLTNDIALAFKVALSTADKMKRKFGVAKASMLTRKEEKTILEVTGVDGQERREVSRGELARVIEARVEETMLMIRDYVEHEGFSPDMEAGIVMTGGSALLPGLARKAEDILGVRPRLGVPRLNAEPDITLADPRVSCAAGLALVGIDTRRTQRRNGPRGWFGSIGRTVRRLVSNF